MNVWIIRGLISLFAFILMLGLNLSIINCKTQVSDTRDGFYDPPPQVKILKKFIVNMLLWNQLYLLTGLRIFHFFSAACE